MTRLNTTPVKGLRVHNPEEITLGANGAVGDRDFLLIDEKRRIVSISKSGPLTQISARFDPDADHLSVTCAEETCAGRIELGDPVTIRWWLDMRDVHARFVHGPWNELFARVVGRPVRLVKTDEPGAAFDTHPVTLLGEGSLRALERESGHAPIDPRRFRMLIQFSSDEEHVEDSWKGAVLTIGSARVRVGGPVARCAAITRDPERGRRDAPLVAAIKSYRGTCLTDTGVGVPFGVYASVLEGGKVRIGDEVQMVWPASG